MRSRLLPSCLLAGLALAATAPLWGTRGSPEIVSLLDPEAVPASPGPEAMPPDGEQEELREAGASARTLVPIPAQEITLQILDEDDEPIPDARARLWSGWPGTSTLLDSFEGEPDGRLVIRFPEAPEEMAASQRIRIEAPGRSPQTWIREAFTAEWRDSVCEEEEPIWCHWLSRGSKVEGSVVGADGEPLEEVEVCLEDVGEATSDRDGHYELAIPAGFSPSAAMTLSASKEGSGRSLLVLHALPINGRLPVLCVRSHHSVKGRASVVPGNSLTGWTLSCRLDEAYDDGVEDGLEDGTGPIDDGGHFEVRGLEAGTYACSLNPPGGAGPNRRASVDVPGFASTRVPLDIRLQVVHVQVEVTQPLKGLVIKVFRVDDLKHPVLTNEESGGEIDEELLLPVGMGLRLHATLGELAVAEARWTVTADPEGDTWPTRIAPEEKLALVRVVFYRGKGIRKVPDGWIPVLGFYDPRSMRWIEAAPLGDDDPVYWMALPVGDHQVMLETDRRRWGCWAMPGMRWTKERFLSQEQHVYDWAPAFHHLRLEPGRLQGEGVPVLRYAPIRSGSVAFLIQDTTRPQTGSDVGIEITHVGPVPRSLPVEARDLWLRSEKQASWQIAPYEALWFWWGVPPGWQQFRIEAEGYAPFSTWVEVKEGIRGLYEVDLAPYRRHPIH